MSELEIRRPENPSEVLAVVSSALYELGALMDGYENPGYIPVSSLVNCLALVAESGILGALDEPMEPEVLSEGLAA